MKQSKRNEQTTSEYENAGGIPQLVETADGLALCDGDRIMIGDFSDMIPRLTPQRLQEEMLVRAAKLKNFDGIPILADATAGMGEDSLILAAAGFCVHMYEYDKTIAALLEDSLKRAMLSPGLQGVVSRMHLHCEDSIAAMNGGFGGEFTPDVILLDPMFPKRTKSALVKKKFQLLQQLEKPCDNENELLEAALSAKPQKIVIKRPLKGPYLAGRKPDYSLEGKAIRYDCIINIR